MNFLKRIMMVTQDSDPTTTMMKMTNSDQTLFYTSTVVKTQTLVTWSTNPSASNQTAKICKMVRKKAKRRTIRTSLTTIFIKGKKK